MKRIILLALILITTSLLWIAGFPFPYFINNYRLNAFASQLEKIPLPSQTQKSGPVIKRFGNLGPCSKHGDYYVEFKIISMLPLQQLKEYYKHFNVYVPQVDNMIFSFFRGLGTHGPQAIKIEKDGKMKNAYVVYVLDLDYWPNDFRCW